MFIFLCVNMLTFAENKAQLWDWWSVISLADKHFVFLIVLNEKSGDQQSYAIDPVGKHESVVVETFYTKPQMWTSSGTRGDHQSLWESLPGSH